MPRAIAEREHREDNDLRHALARVDEAPRLNPNYESDESSSFDLGSAAHSLMLGDPKQFEIIQADSFATKEATSRHLFGQAASHTRLAQCGGDVR